VEVIHLLDLRISHVVGAEVFLDIKVLCGRPGCEGALLEVKVESDGRPIAHLYVLSHRLVPVKRQRID
jgi:hypothetical protein